MTDSERDQAAIAAVLGGPQERSAVEPVQRQRSRPVGRFAATTTADEHDDDEADDGSDLEGIVTAPVISTPRAPVVIVQPVAKVPEGIASVPVPSVPLPDLPSIESVPAVITATASVARLVELRAAVATEIGTVETALGLKPGAGSRDIERLAVQLLAAGKSDDEIAKLESLRVRHRRLAGAEELATKALLDAKDLARRELSERAAEVEFRPAARASALALLELIRCKAAEVNARSRVQAAGFALPHLPFHSDLLDPWSNGIVLNLVRDGWLTAAEVRTALPHMSGV